MSFLNKEISKALLGSTETTEASKSSGYAQSKEHADQDDNKKESDLVYVRRVLNSRFIKILKAFGLPYEGGEFVIPEQEAKLSPKEKFDMYVSMATSLSMPIDHDYIYELTGMPKPKDYDAQMEAKKAATELETQILDYGEENEDANTPTPSGKKTAKSKGKSGKKPGKLKLSFREKLAIHMMDFFG